MNIKMTRTSEVLQYVMFGSVMHSAYVRKNPREGYYVMFMTCLLFLSRTQYMHRNVNVNIFAGVFTGNLTVPGMILHNY